MQSTQLQNTDASALFDTSFYINFFQFLENNLSLFNIFSYRKHFAIVILKHD